MSEYHFSVQFTMTSMIAHMQSICHIFNVLIVAKIALWNILFDFGSHAIGIFSRRWNRNNNEADQSSRYTLMGCKQMVSTAKGWRSATILPLSGVDCQQFCLRSKVTQITCYVERYPTTGALHVVKKNSSADQMTHLFLFFDVYAQCCSFINSFSDVFFSLFLPPKTHKNIMNRHKK